MDKLTHRDQGHALGGETALTAADTSRARLLACLRRVRVVSHFGSSTTIRTGYRSGDKTKGGIGCPFTNAELVSVRLLTPVL